VEDIKYLSRLATLIGLDKHSGRINGSVNANFELSQRSCSVETSHLVVWSNTIW